jgi:pyruvate, water dikinase
MDTLIELIEPDPGPLVLAFGAAGAGDRRVVGGKAASLAELVGAGFRVPAGCAVTTAAFELAMGAADPGGSIPAEVAALDAGDHARLAEVTAAIRARVVAAPLPGALRAAIAAGYRATSGGAGAAGGGGGPVAVRSSATAEDSADASFAGLQETFLWVTGEGEVLDRVRHCWASLYSAESVAYRLRRGLPEDGMAMAVVVQRMVDARCSGVMFTRSPATGDRSVVAIEASWGLGSAVVSGEVTPDAWVVSKVTGEIVKRKVARKLCLHRPDPEGQGVVGDEVPERLRDLPCLSDSEVLALAELGRRVERHYGSPQDIEWAIERDAGPGDPPFLLQSRPETVWSGRPAAPLAAPRRRPFDHVLRGLGQGGASRSGGGERA